MHDLLQESDLFARSFSGGGFGLLSPLDFVHVLSLATEIISHMLLIISLTRGATHFGVLFLSIFSATLPFLIARFSFRFPEADSPYNVREARAADRQERMRNLAYSEAHRAEVALFGLGEWILQSWATARKIVLSSEQPQILRDSILSRLNMSDLSFALQNVCLSIIYDCLSVLIYHQIPVILLMQTSAASLGSLTLYRASVQSLVFACRNLVTTTRMAFHGIFLMSAFSASMKVKPRLQPDDDEEVTFTSLPGGLSIEAR